LISKVATKIGGFKL